MKYYLLAFILAFLISRAGISFLTKKGAFMLFYAKSKEIGVLCWEKMLAYGSDPYLPFAPQSAAGVQLRRFAA